VDRSLESSLRSGLIGPELLLPSYVASRARALAEWAASCGGRTALKWDRAERSRRASRARLRLYPKLFDG